MHLAIRVKVLAVVSVIFGSLLLASSASEAESDISSARTSATSWLSKLDADQFSECWELLSSDSRKGISRWRWNFQCKMGRFTLGQARSRKEKSAERTTKSPGGHPGEFVLLSYETSSDKKGLITEHVAVQKDHDNHWRVCGYGISQEEK